MDKKRNGDKNPQYTNQIRRERILGPDSPYAIKEAYVQLRTNLMFSVAMEEEEKCCVFQVTSPNPSEGKSLTAANIAISFAMLGKKTLLIDCDMRKPTQHKLWNIKGQQGLSNLLTNVDKSIIHQVKGLALSVLTAGAIPPNPSELIASKRFAVVIGYLKTKYDYIIIDTPPVNVVSDAQILAQHVNGVVVVAYSGKTRREEVRRTMETLERSGGKICGVVINGLNEKSTKYSYRYGKEYSRGTYYEAYEANN